MEVEAQRRLVSKPRTTASVWKHFGFEPDENGNPKNPDRPTCRTCYLEVSAKDGNTTNLYSHLRNKHPKEFSEVSKDVRTATSLQSKLPQLFKHAQAIPTTSREHKELTKAIALCLAKDMLPIYTVEKPGFKSMIHQFNPRYQLPGRMHFNRVALPALASDVTADIERELASNLCFFSGTTDLWTSGAGDPYLSFTCHFIDPYWELKSYCLSTQYLPEDHTAHNIKEALSETLHLWKLDRSHLVALTTDSGSNVKAACELLCCRRLSCFGHNLNFSVEKGLDERRVKRTLKICKSAVASFSRSWKKQRDLTQVQNEKNLPNHKLKLDVVTRWGSSLEMVDRIMEQIEAIRIVLGADRHTSHLVPSWQDCDVMSSIMKALKPLKEMTDALSGE